MQVVFATREIELRGPIYHAHRFSTKDGVEGFIREGIFHSQPIFCSVSKEFLERVELISLSVLCIGYKDRQHEEVGEGVEDVEVDL